MYPVSETLREILEKSHNKSIAITVYPTSGNSYTITEADITGSATIDRYCVSGEAIQLGTAISSEFTFTLNNYSGKFDDKVFEGAELYAVLNIKEPDSTNNYIPLGYYTIDVHPRKRATINISALDRMMHFQKPYSNNVIYPATIGEIITKSCQACNVTLATLVHTLPNYNYMVSDAPTGDDLTFRDIIRWCAEITGTCAYMDWEGKLRFEWYKDTGITISPSDRYPGADNNETDMIVASIESKRGKDTRILASGEGNHILTITENQLIQGDAPISYSNVIGMKYRPYECETLSMPYMYPLDKITYVDSLGNSMPSLITHITWRMNGRTSMKGKGISETKSGYAASNPLTEKERNIISGMVEDVVGEDINKQLTQMEQATLLLNQMMFGSLGLYFTTVVNPDGDKQIYAHDKPTLAESSTIYTMNAGGFAYTNIGWNDGDPIWLYGFTSDGNAVYKALSVYHLSADLITAGTMTADHIKGGSLVLGGANNTDGILQLKNASGAVVMQADNTGLKVSNAVITGGSITLPASSAEDGKITITYGNLITQLRPYGFITEISPFEDDNLHHFAEINPLAVNIGATAVGGSAVLGSGSMYMRGSKSYVDTDYGNFDSVYTEDSVNRAYIGVNGTALTLGALLPTGEIEKITGQLSSGPPWYSYSTLNIGQLVATQSKSKVEKTENYNDRLLYCYEMPSPMYGDIGGGQTDESGICYIGIDPIFYETLENTFEYYVFLQKYGEGDIHVSEITKEYFVVKGSPNLKFAWEIKGKQKGFGLDRLEEYDIENSKKIYDDELPNLSDAIYDNIASEIISEYERELGI